MTIIKKNQNHISTEEMCFDKKYIKKKKVKRHLQWPSQMDLTRNITGSDLLFAFTDLFPPTIFIPSIDVFSFIFYFFVHTRQMDLRRVLEFQRRHSLLFRFSSILGSNEGWNRNVHGQ